MSTPHRTGPTYLGIDLGTSSVKAYLIDENARPLTQATRDYPVEYPAPGHVETDPENWWTAVVDAVRDVVSHEHGQVRGIGLSGQMHGLVLTDAARRPTRKAMLWADARATAQIDAYRALPGPALAALGNPLTPGMAGPMLKWVAEHEPQIYATSTWALSPKDWIRARLTGLVCSEPSDASATLLYDTLADGWAEDTIEALGLRRELFAPLRADSGQLAGELAGGVADDLGLTAGTPVAAGAADTAASALGSWVVATRDAQLTVGTGAQIVVPRAAPRIHTDGVGDPAPFRTHLYRAALPGAWYEMAAVVSGGLTLSWVCSTLGASWQELYDAAGGPPRPNDPVFVPHLSGERSPYMDPQLRASWSGIGPQHDRNSLLRSALEGVAFTIREAMEAIPDLGTAEQLRLAGGGTTSNAWRQMLSDVLDVALYATDVPAASARGAAALGMVVAGDCSWEELGARLQPSPALAATPDTSTVPLYEERRARFQQVVDALR